MKRIKDYILTIFIFSIFLQSYTQNPNPYFNLDSAYTNVITGRAAKIVNSLELNDSLKYYRVQSIIVEQYRHLAAIHDFKNAQVNKAKTLDGNEKEKGITIAKDSANAQLYIQHTFFIASLSSELNPELIEMVKDGMTYNVFQNTFNGYLDMLPRLTDEQRYIFTALYQARELAMDEGSSDAKHAVFGKYKGRINNYLSKQGYDMAKESKAWEERLKQEKEKNKNGMIYYGFNFAPLCASWRNFAL